MTKLKLRNASGTFSEIATTDYVDSEISTISDYNNLTNKPITNLDGTEDNPIILFDLEEGLYLINNYFKYYSAQVESTTFDQLRLIEVTKSNEHESMLMGEYTYVRFIPSTPEVIGVMITESNYEYIYRTSDYNDLTNKPITNLDGTYDNPTILYDLDEGLYLIDNYFKHYSSQDAPATFGQPTLISVTKTNEKEPLMYVQFIPYTEGVIGVKITDSSYENIYHTDQVSVGSTEPTNGEEVWLQTSGSSTYEGYADKKIYTKNADGVYEEFSTTNIDGRFGKNLFNKNNGIISGYYIDDNGLLGASDKAWYQPSYIKVFGDTAYTISSDVAILRVAYYDKDKNFISRVTTTTTELTFTTPSNCEYIMVGGNTDGEDTLQVELGTVKTEYADYVYPTVLIKDGNGNFNEIEVLDKNNIINNLPTIKYSTSEQVIGTWLDGKPLYRKVIEKTVAKTTTSNFTLSSLGISSVDVVIINTGASTAHYGTTVGMSYSPVSYYISSSDRAHVYLNNTGSLVIQNQNSNQRTYYIVLEYTKTTDTAGSNGTATSYLPAGSGKNLQIYSENETMVGVWIDGKPIYRKTLTLTKGTDFSSNSTTVAHNIANIDKITDLKAMSYSSSTGLYRPFAWAYYTTQSDSKYYGGVAINTTNFKLEIGTSLYSDMTSLNITVEYTKTTD